MITHDEMVILRDRMLTTCLQFLTEFGHFDVDSVDFSVKLPEISSAIEKIDISRYDISLVAASKDFRIRLETGHSTEESTPEYAAKFLN